MLTDSPLKKIFHKPDVSGRLLKWSIEISGYDVSFEARRAIKAQALADFIAETTFQQGDPSDAPHLGDEEAGRSRPPESEVPWALFIDGAANKEGCGADVCLVTPENDQVIEQAIMFNFPASNNQAEYEALIVGLDLAFELGIQFVIAHSDSQLIVNQVRGEYEAINHLLVGYCSLV